MDEFSPSRPGSWTSLTGGPAAAGAEPDDECVAEAAEEMSAQTVFIDPVCSTLTRLAQYAQVVEKP